jgi:hypothetical protein
LRKITKEYTYLSQIEVQYTYLKRKGIHVFENYGSNPYLEKREYIYLRQMGVHIFLNRLEYKALRKITIR